MKMKDKKLHNKFNRLEKIIGYDKLDYLISKSVLIIGIGGVGGYALESLVRCGIGGVIIVDFDIIDESNINRQIIALNSTIGMKKVDAFEERIHDINDKCEVIKINKFIDDSNIFELFSNHIDFVIDACDTINTKKIIISECLKRKIDFISCMGTGNKFDPSKLEIVDIRKTINDPLARIIRKYVKDNNIKDKVMVLSSKEIPIKIDGRTPGSTSFVPSSAGLLITSYVINKFIQEKEKN